MDASSETQGAVTLNARVTAVVFAVAASLTLVLTHVDQSLTPLRMLVLALTAFAAWGFCDEMGMQKPLNRAGFVFFSMAAAAKIQLNIGVAPEVAGRAMVFYAAFLLLSLLCWSVALLHRHRTLKILGAVGVAATLTPLAVLVLGHLAVGFGTVLGVAAVLSPAAGAGTADQPFVMVVERLFGIWAYVAAWLLWSGRIRAKAVF